MLLFLKLSKSLFTVILIVLIGIGWASAGFDVVLKNTNKEYNQHLEYAKKYYDRGLYQMAIKEYKEAGIIKENKSTNEKILNAYEKRFKETDSILTEYISFLTDSIQKYKSEAKYYIKLSDLYVYSNNYESAYKALKKGTSNCKKNKELSNKLEKLLYSFQLDWIGYSDIYPESNGYYAVKNNESWGIIDDDGKSIIDTEYSFITSVGDMKIFLSSKENSEILDTTGLVQGKIDGIPESSGIFANDLMPIQLDGVYSYYDVLGDKKFGNYKIASNYHDGRAIAQKQDDEWVVVDKKGKETKTEFKDVLFDKNGNYVFNNLIFAKVDKKYSLFNKNFKKIGSFSCDSIDPYDYDGLIAFEENKMWGFVNSKGKIIIKPQYEVAKNFSNGLAAVCKDGKWGFIDKNQKLVIGYQFLDADYFNAKKNCFVKENAKNWKLLKFVLDK